jgi:Tol biopolymer transport system component
MRVIATVLALSAVLLSTAPAAVAQDSDAPRGALPHWLPSERWVYQHWLPYDEGRLERVLDRTRGQLWQHLRDDAVHNLAQLARRRGMTPREAAVRLVEPRRGKVSRAMFATLVSRAERTLTQGHLSQHILFHSLHQLAIPDRARWIFGTRSVEAYLAMRRAELSPQQIGRLHGRTQSQMLARANAALRTEADKGVRNGSFTRRQARILLDRQLRQVPRFLGQSRYNGPPRTSPAFTPELPPNDYANNPSISADGASVVFDAYRATIPEAKALGEIRVERVDLATLGRSVVAPSGPARSPTSAYNAQISADGSSVVFERAEGNRNFAKRYGAMQVLFADLRRRTLAHVSHRDIGGSRTAYNPSVSADGGRVAYLTSDDRGRGGRSVNALEVRDRRTGAVMRLRSGGDDAVFEPRISGDGRSVGFTVADGRSAVHVRALPSGPTRRVARDARDPAFSHDARVVAYTTGSAGRSVLSVRDLGSGRVTRITRSADGRALDPALTPDGRFVAFALRRGERSSVHLADVRTGRTVEVSPAGAGTSAEPAVSADGNRVVFTTTVALEGKPAGTPGVVVHDVAAGTTTLLSTHDAIKAGPGAKAQAAAMPLLCELAP